MKKYTIQDIKSSIKYSLVGGPFGSDLTGKHYTETGVPVIRGTNLPFDHRFSCDDFVFVSKKKADSLKSNTAYPGDLVFTQRGTLGQVGIVPDDYDRYIISQSQMKLTVNHDIADPLYVYYYFRAKKTVKEIENYALTSGVPHINLGILQKFKIFLPDLPNQQKIASILSSYDDLIENNNQRIKLLEEMAEEIYKEWFVRLRFPGYENSKFFDKDGNEVEHGMPGAIPEGWEMNSLSFFVDNIKTKYVDKKHENLGMYDLSRIPRKSLLVPEFGASDELESSRIIFEKDDILFGSIRPYFHKVSSANKKGITNVSVIILRLKVKEIKPYVLMTLFNDNFIKWATNYSNGTKMPTISWNEIQKYTLLVPRMGLIEKFYSIAMPMIEEIHLLSDKNIVLKETRDLLLPRLISGKIDVSKLTID